MSITLDSEMTPAEMKDARMRLRLTMEQMALMLGYRGNNVKAMQNDLESGRKRIGGAQRRLVEAYLAGFRPFDWPE